MGVAAPLEGITKESLRAEIAQLNEKIWDAENRVNKDSEYHLTLELDEWISRRDHCAAVLKQWNSDKLIQEAIQWGVEIPDREDWWTEYISESPSRLHTQKLEWLSPIGQTMVSKQIRDARFAYWKGWAEILIPILSLLVAIIAILKR